MVEKLQTERDSLNKRLNSKKAKNARLQGKLNAVESEYELFKAKISTESIDSQNEFHNTHAKLRMLELELRAKQQQDLETLEEFKVIRDNLEQKNKLLLELEIEKENMLKEIAFLKGEVMEREESYAGKLERLEEQVARVREKEEEFFMFENEFKVKHEMVLRELDLVNKGMIHILQKSSVLAYENLQNIDYTVLPAEAKLTYIDKLFQYMVEDINEYHQKRYKSKKHTKKEDSERFSNIQSIHQLKEENIILKSELKDLHGQTQ